MCRQKCVFDENTCMTLTNFFSFGRGGDKKQEKYCLEKLLAGHFDKHASHTNTGEEQGTHSTVKLANEFCHFIL